MHVRARRHPRRGKRAFVRRDRESHPPDHPASRTQRRWSTTSVFRSAASTRPTITPARSVPRTAKSRSSLREDHRPTREYIRSLREVLPGRFPGTTFSFLPADIISQILNFGAPAPIEVQIRGSASGGRTSPTRKICCAGLRHVPGLVDARIQQSLSAPSFDVDVDRTRAKYVGITERDVTNSMVVNLAGSGQVQPTFWLNPDNGVNYSIVHADAGIPSRFAQRAAKSADHCSGVATPPQMLGRHRRHQANARPRRCIRNTTFCRSSSSTPPPRAAISAPLPQTCRKFWMKRRRARQKARRLPCSGKSRPWIDSFAGLIFGLAAAIVLIYLVIVVNFQSWSDPFVIITALPAALAGIVWMLFATGTTLIGTGAHRRHHVHGRRYRQQRARHQFRQGAARGARRCRRGGDRGGFCPLAPGGYDGSRHDHRHAADGARPGRRRRAKCAIGPCGRRRTCVSQPLQL